MTACDHRGQSSIGFGFCATHDETFPLGAICPEYRRALRAQMVRARAQGRFLAAWRAMRALEADNRARGVRS